MLSEIFGENCKRAKVFDLLLSHPYTEYTKTDIADCAEISRNTLDTFINDLLDYGIINKTRRIGNGQLYQINMKSTITQALNSFQNQLADIEFEKEMKTYKETVDEKINPIKPFEEIIKNEIVKEEKIESEKAGTKLIHQIKGFDSTLDVSNKPFNNIWEQVQPSGAMVAHNFGMTKHKSSLISIGNIKSNSLIELREN